MKTTREAESALLHNAKSLLQQAQIQRSELEKGEAFPDTEDNEVKRLRTELLKHSNDLAATDERLYQLEFKIGSLQEEKRLLEREYSRMPKKDEIDKQIKDLEKTIEDYRVEIAQRSHESNNLKEELGVRHQQIELLERNVEKKQLEEQNFKASLTLFCNSALKVS